MTPAELKRAVGARIFDEFYPDRLYNHDAEDPDGDRRPRRDPPRRGRRAVQARRRVRPARLREPQHRHDGRRPQVGRGRPRARTTVVKRAPQRPLAAPLAVVHGPAQVRAAPPRRTARATSSRRAVPIFHIETTLNNDMYDGPLAFLAKPEARWTPREQTTFAALEAHDRPDEPEAAPRGLPQASTAPYAVTGVHRRRGRARARGDARALRRRSRRSASRGQADIVTAGLPYVGPYNVNSILNPVLVMCMGLGYFFNLYQGVPARARGRRDDLHAPGRARVPPGPPPLLRRLLRGGAGETTDPAEIEQRFEKSYAEDEWYRHLYRTSLRLPRRAPVLHVVLGRARAAAPRRRDLRRRRPGGLPPAWASAAPTRCATRWRWPSRSSGRDPSLTHFHCPPLFYAQVEA